MDQLPNFQLYFQDIYNKAWFTVGFFEIIPRILNIVFQSLHLKTFGRTIFLHIKQDRRIIFTSHMVFKQGEITHTRLFKLNETTVINPEHNIQISTLYTVKCLLINVNLNSFCFQWPFMGQYGSDTLIYLHFRYDWWEIWILRLIWVRPK